jgi:hypothetical protein
MEAFWDKRFCVAKAAAERGATVHFADIPQAQCKAISAGLRSKVL